jgi:cell division septation protein DedD
MASGRKRGAGERVLESQHVIGLFLLMLVFSAIFFTLGYVMGRNQYDGQVRAATTQHVAPEPVVTNKTDAASNRLSNKPAVPDAAASGSDWEFYSSDKQRETDDHLKAGSAADFSSAPKTSPQSIGNGRSAAVNGDSARSPQSSGGYTLQVTAVRRESDALELARRLQKRKFPAFVLAPLGNKYYRVQVGPYADQKSAEAAKKGLENAGFRAIVKRG